MKIKLLFNRPRWGYKKRVGRLEASLSKRLAPIYGKVRIDTEDVDLELVMKGEKLSEPWFRETFKGKYDSFGLIIDPKDWEGRPTLLGHYVDGTPKLSFYVITDDKRKVKRSDGKSYFVFEDTIEHELGHAVYQDMGAYKKPPALEKVRLPGFDNTHYWWEKKHDVDGMWSELYERWEVFRKKQLDKLTQAQIDIDAVIGEKKWGLVPELARKYALLKYQCGLEGITIKITSGFRSFEEQAELYAQGRTTPGPIVTNAKPGQSKHNFGTAFDIYPLEAGWDDKHPDWKKIGSIGESLGLEWGGRWKFRDLPHFELGA